MLLNEYSPGERRASVVRSVLAVMSSANAYIIYVWLVPRLHATFASALYAPISQDSRAITPPKHYVQTSEDLLSIMPCHSGKHLDSPHCTTQPEGTNQPETGRQATWPPPLHLAHTVLTNALTHADGFRQRNLMAGPYPIPCPTPPPKH